MMACGIYVEASSKKTKSGYRIEYCDAGVWKLPIRPLKRPRFEKATFALALFWFPEAQFGCLPGVVRTRVGYCGGKFPKPSDAHVGDHTEAIEIEFDTTLTTYQNLLQQFWLNHDPTVRKNRRHMSAIFYHHETQRCMAYISKAEREEVLGTEIKTQILPYQNFYNAENYHQKYVLQTYHRSLFKSLDLSNEDLIDSTVATKINGYVGGFGTIEVFNKECYTFGLTAENIDYVRRMFWP